MTKTSSNFKSFIRNNIIQAVVIILSVLLSFYLEDRRQENITKQEKNYLLTDLSKTLESDIYQIEIILENLGNSDKNLVKLLNDINNNHTLLSDREVVKILLQIQIGTSFFPQDGIFNELIANGSFNLIENEELKSLLLNMYTHKKERNYATSVEIDNFNLLWRRQIMGNFRIQFNYNSYDGEIYGQQELTRFRFNRQYYLSNELYGALSQSRIYVGMYTRFLNDQKNEYQTALALSKTEIGED
ncbi:MAG: hypothetical protein ISR03_03680 [Flavobacteriales bacterium]|nr:hypothetical protein [Flavobacteriales bacterium]